MTTRVLVTGGAGYVGSHVCKALAEAGCEPVALDNLVRGHRWAVKWGPLVESDLSDSEQLASVLRAHSIDVVMHFAAHAYVGESMQYPHLYFQNNVAGALNLLQAMQTAGIRRFVFSSTCATYGNPQYLPLDEDHTPRPVNPYGESKLFVERVLGWYATCHGLQYATLRYFNAAGADPNGEVGEAHEPETHLIPLAIQVALGSRPELSIFGTDYDTADGTAIRDYVHVMDIAAGHLAALEYLQNQNKSLTVNLGAGQGCSVLEIVTAVEQATGRRIAVSECPRRAGDPPVLIADISRASTLLGWQPARSSINEIVQDAVNWHRQTKQVNAA